MLASDHREHRKNVRVISRTKIASAGARQIEHLLSSLLFC
jgi:hypothetical protein